MNNKEATLYKIIDIVVGCCATDVGNGVMSVTKEDVLGTSRKQNHVMTRCILARMIAFAGYSTDTTSMLLKRSPKQVRNMIADGQEFYATSRAYRIAEAEATLLCRNLDDEGL